MIMNNDAPKHRNESTQNRSESDVSAKDIRRHLYDVLLPDDDFSHEEAEAQLPLYVTDELLGRPVHKLYPRLHRHLIHCQQCIDLYADMMQDLTEEGVVAVAVPKPNLDFLSQPSTTRWESLWGDVRSATKEALQSMVASTWPQLQDEITMATRILFRQLDHLGDDLFLQTNAARALGFGSGDIPLGQKLAIATYRCHVTIRERFAPSGEPPSMALSSIVEKAAEDVGLSIEERKHFVSAYIAWVTKDDEK